MLLLALLAGCFSPERPPSPPTVLNTGVDGSDPVSPTLTIAVQLSAPIDPDSVDAVALVRGEADGQLVAALGRPPLAERLLPELVAVQTSIDKDVLVLTPRRALEPHSRYTLVIGAALRAGGGRLGRAVLRAFSTSGMEDAAPILQLIDPPEGAAGVVRNLRQVVLGWQKPMPKVSLELVAEDGTVWPSTTVQVGDHLLVTLGAVLDADRSWQVRAPAGLTDEQGRPPFGDPPGFTSGNEIRSAPPELIGLELEPADRCLVVRFSSDRPSEAELCVGDRCRAEPRQMGHAIGVSLAEAEDGWTLRAWDESTAPETKQEGVVMMPPVPLVLTEVLAEPLGPRLPQQFVELFNVGDQPVEMSGLVLRTASGFDLLPAGSLPSGRFAVVVPSGFADDGIDVPPLPDSLLLRLSSARLGGRGIREGGEPVWLEDASGKLITRWGGFAVVLSAGQSLSRYPFDCDLPDSFRPGRPTPGG
jgi:hypothetical protein